MAHQPDAVQLQPGQTITVGDTKITVDYPGSPAPAAGDDTVHLKPGQSITVGDTEVVAGGLQTTMPVISQPYQPVTPLPNGTDLVGTQPVTTTPNPYAGTRPITVQDFASRFALPLLLSDGSTVLAVSPTGAQTFGIPAGTPLSEVDFTKLNAQYAMTAEGQIVARTRDQVELQSQAEVSPVASASTPSSSASSTSSTKASTVDERHVDTSKYLETVQSLATQAMENTGDETTKKLTGAGKFNAASKKLPNTGGTAGASAGAAEVDTASLGFPIAASGKSWLMAIAEAMGKVLGNKVQQMLDSSSKMASLNVTSQAIGDVQKKIESDISQWKKDHPGFTVEQFNDYKLKEIDSRQAVVDNEMKMNGTAFTLEGSKLQGASQEFSMLQNAFSNTLKSIGEGLGQLARKG